MLTFDITTPASAPSHINASGTQKEYCGLGRLKERLLSICERLCRADWESEDQICISSGGGRLLLLLAFCSPCRWYFCCWADLVPKLASRVGSISLVGDDKSRGTSRLAHLGGVADAIATHQRS